MSAAVLSRTVVVGDPQEGGDAGLRYCLDSCHDPKEAEYSLRLAARKESATE